MTERLVVRFNPLLFSYYKFATFIYLYSLYHIMASFKIKSRGRPKSELKIRSVDGISPKGFAFAKFDRKNKAIVYKKLD